MANRLKRVVSKVLCATVMLTMTAVPGAVFAQTDVESGEQPEVTAQTENQATTPEREAGEVTQESKQTPEASQETAKAPAKQQKAAAQPQTSKIEAKVPTQAARSATGVTITTPGNKTIFCTGTSIELTAKIQDRNGGFLYTYQWYKNGKKIKWALKSTYDAETPGEYSVEVKEHRLGTDPVFTASITVTSQAHEAEWYENGGYHYKHCKNCNANMSSAENHTVTKVEKPANCTDSGHESYWTCSVCEYKFSDEACTNKIDAPKEIPATGHDMTKTEAKAATCTEDGNREYWECGKCKKLFKNEDATEEFKKFEDTVIPAGHDWEDHYTVDKAPTCTEPGSCSIHCKNCEATTKQEVIPVDRHNIASSYTPEKPATCIEDGYEGYWTCKTCGKLFADEGCEKELSEPTIIPATGHKFGEWTVKKPAAIGTEGLKERACEKCGYTETAVIPALEASKTDLNNKTELAKKTAEKKNDKSAKTGDDSSIALYALLAVLAAGGACGTVYRRKFNG